MHVVSVSVVLAGVVAIDQTLPDSSIVVSLFFAAALIFWITGKAHGLVTLSPPQVGVELRPDDECWPDRRDEEHEAPEEDEQIIEISLGLSGAAADRDWSCPACGEENTKEFALCWSCGHAYSANET